MSCENGAPQVMKDEVDAISTAETKRDTILEKINKRNKDRQNYIDTKQELRIKEEVNASEGADYFAQTFAERVRLIEARIQNINETATKKTQVGDVKSDLTRLFASLTIDIQELQRYLTSSTMFLTEYKIKACQQILNELNASCDETRLRLLPKKKFGFSAKRNKERTVNDEKAPIIKEADKIDPPKKSNFAWTIENLNDQHICLSAKEVNNQDITISNLSHCLVELPGHAGSVQISNAVNCTFFCGPISRSFFAEHCDGCTIVVACQQLRLHSSHKSRIHLHVTSRAIIEDCNEIEITTPYCYNYATLEEDFAKSGLDRSRNNYADIADFNWLSPDAPSPNWTLLENVPALNWKEVCARFKTKSGDNSTL